MSGSLQAAMRALPGDADGLLVILVDQPLVEAEHLEQLKRNWLTDSRRICASVYGGHTGVPAILPTYLWPQIERLSGDTGARKLFRRSPEIVTTIECPAAATDIDTSDDLRRLASVEAD